MVELGAFLLEEGEEVDFMVVEMGRERVEERDWSVDDEIGGFEFGECVES